MQLFNAFKNIKPGTKSMDALLDGFLKDLKNLNNKFPIIKPNKTPTGSKLSSSDIEIESNSNNIAQADIEDQGSIDTNLALAPMGNVFLLGGNDNNNQQTTPPPIINVDGGGMIAMTNPFDAVAANLLFESALTT